jgi:hypothetical protein
MQKGDVFIGVSTYFGHHHAHHLVDSKKTDNALHLLGLVSRPAKPMTTISHRTTSSPRVYCSTASAVHQRRCRFHTVLLMMGMMMPETC